MHGIRIIIFRPPLRTSDNQFPVLEPGQRVRLKQGFGCPMAEEDKELVVAWTTTRGGVLLADGTCVCCKHTGGVELLPGDKVPIALSDKARATLVNFGMIGQFEEHVAATA